MTEMRTRVWTTPGKCLYIINPIYEVGRNCSQYVTIITYFVFFRWFHKFCTQLKVVDDSFCCKLVQKTCLVRPVL